MSKCKYGSICHILSCLVYRIILCLICFIRSVLQKCIPWLPVGTENREINSLISIINNSSLTCCCPGFLLLYCFCWRRKNWKRIYAILFIFRLQVIILNILTGSSTLCLSIILFLKSDRVSDQPERPMDVAHLWLLFNHYFPCLGTCLVMFPSEQFNGSLISPDCEWDPTASLMTNEPSQLHTHTPVFLSAFTLHNRNNTTTKKRYQKCTMTAVFWYNVLC